MAHLIDALVAHYKVELDGLHHGRPIIPTGKSVERHFALDHVGGRAAEVACGITVHGSDLPSDFIHNIIVGLLLIEKELLERGAIDLRAEIRQGDHAVIFGSRMSIARSQVESA